MGQNGWPASNPHTQLVAETYDAIADRFASMPEGAPVLELDEVVTFHEPEGDATFQWILGRT